MKVGLMIIYAYSCIACLLIGARLGTMQAQKAAVVVCK